MKSKSKDLKCPYCGSKNIVWAKKITSVLNHKKYDLNTCNDCFLHFFTPLKFENVYDTEINEGYVEFHKGRNYYPVWSLEAAKALKELDVDVKNSKIFDVGSGDCINYPLLVEKFRIKPNNYHALDLDRRSLLVCKRRGVKNIYPIYFDKRTIQKIRETFDVILATEVLEHQVDPKTFFETSFSMLKKGGYMVITVPYKNIAPIPWKHRQQSPPPHHFLMFDRRFFRKNFRNSKVHLVLLRAYSLHRKGELMPNSRFAAKELFGTGYMWPITLIPAAVVRIIDKIIGHGLIVVIRKR